MTEEQLAHGNELIKEINRHRDRVSLYEKRLANNPVNVDVYNRTYYGKEATKILNLLISIEKEHLANYTHSLFLI